MGSKTNIQFDMSPEKCIVGPNGLLSKRILSFDCGYRSLGYALVDAKMEIDICPLRELAEAIRAPGPDLLARAQAVLDEIQPITVQSIGCIDVCRGTTVRSNSFKALNLALISALDEIIDGFGPLFGPGVEILIEFQPNTICLDSYSVMCQITMYFARMGYNVNFIDPSHKLSVDVGGPTIAQCRARCCAKYAANKLFAKESLEPFLARFGGEELLADIPKCNYNHIGDALLQVLPAIEISGARKYVEGPEKKSGKGSLGSSWARTLGIK